MKKKLLLEFIFATATLLIAIFAFNLNQNQSFWTELGSLILEKKFLIKYYIIFQIWLLLYFTVNIIRQFWLKLGNPISNASIIIVSLIFIFLLSNYVHFLSESGVILNDEGLTIYPPLTAIPLSKQDNRDYLKNIIDTLYIIELIFCLIAIYTAFKTYQNLKLNKF